jgi:glutamine---fructose-6-phosphate transaminase (isomerizing)
VCGLFGLLRSPDAGDPARASAGFVLLGILAEERGRHAAGVALLPAGMAGDPAPAGCARYADVRVGGCRVARRTGPFSGLWRPALDADLDRSAVAIGHTRWATQGGLGLAAASPVVTGTLIGTHNGDVDAEALRDRFSLQPGPGRTDSEAIFQALAAAGDADGRVRVLAALHGRAALAWADRALPGRVVLGRAALSPLAVGIDDEANLWWASNPQWLRIIGQEAGVRLTSLKMLAEGTYAELAAGRPPRLLLQRRFTPVCRPSDERMAAVAWRGISPADRSRSEQPGATRRQVA